MAVNFPTYSAPTVFQLAGGEQERIEQMRAQTAAMQTSTQTNQLRLEAMRKQMEEAEALKREEAAANEAFAALYQQRQPQAQAPAAPPTQVAQPAAPQAPVMPTAPAAQPPAAEAPPAPVQQPPVLPAGAAEALRPQERRTPALDQAEWMQQQLSAEYLPNGLPNPVSAKFISQKQQALAQLVADGKLRPATAQSMMQGTMAAVNKLLQDNFEMQKIAIDTETSIADKRKAIVEARRKQLFDSAFVVLDAIQQDKVAGSEFAKQVFGADFDVNDPTNIATITTLARQSPAMAAAEKAKREAAKEARDAAKAEREEREASRKDLGLDAMRDLPPGVRPVVVGQDEQGAPKVRFVDADGNFVSQRQIQAWANTQRRAGETPAERKEAKAARDLDVATRGAFDNAVTVVDNVQRLINSGAVEQAAGWQNLFGLTRVPGTSWRQSKQDIINVFNNAVLDYKMAMTQAGGSVRMFDANKEAEALEKAVANLDWNAGDDFIKQQMNGILGRMNRGITNLNRAREAEGLPPLTATGNQPGQPRQPAGQPAQQPRALPPVNAKGWRLMVDDAGNRAYVSPDGKSFEEAR